MSGPTASSLYWSASTLAGGPTLAWTAFFNTGDVEWFNFKTTDWFVRAVRVGSCN